MPSARFILKTYVFWDGRIIINNEVVFSARLGTDGSVVFHPTLQTTKVTEKTSAEQSYGVEPRVLVAAKTPGGRPVAEDPPF